MTFVSCQGPELGGRMRGCVDPAFCARKRADDPAWCLYAKALDHEIGPLPHTPVERESVDIDQIDGRVIDG